MSTITAYAPSNIALIKYMGKIAAPNTSTVDVWAKNRATNSSLSVTLNHLLTRVDINESYEGADSWQPLEADGWERIELSTKGADRFLQHFKFLKERWQIKGSFILSSANNFPSDCGLASSASSFAALTAATAKLAMAQNPSLDLTVEQISQASRVGSGSSIRSFYGPYCIWEKDRAFEVESLNLPLVHQVVVVEDSKKEVSSSEAHLRVATSPLFEGRIERAEKLLKDLCESLEALSAGNATSLTQSSKIYREWQRVYQICWNEFQDMHSLFITAKPPFSYFTQGTDQVLQWAAKLWQDKGDGPIVTMDAGANVHFLTRVDQVELRKQIAREFAHFKVFSQNESDVGQDVSVLGAKGANL